MTKTILLADDSVTIQKVIELTFMDGDYRVVAVSNGHDALERLAEVTPDLVIADVHMPGTTGYEVSKRSKALFPQVPVLLLVGTFESFDEAEAKASGADAHLKKPFDSQELLELAGGLLGSAAPEAAAAAEPAVPAAPAGDGEAAAVAGPAAAQLDEPFALSTAEPAVTAGEDEVFQLDWQRGEAAAPAEIGEPELSAPGEEDGEDLLLVDDSPFAAPAGDVGEAEPFSIGVDEEEPLAAVEEELVDDSPFRERAAAVSAEEALDLAREQAPSPPQAEPAAVGGPAVAPAAAGLSPLSDQDVERIARRVAEVLGERVVREVAWEVIPDLAEVVIKDRLRELEGQVD